MLRMSENERKQRGSEKEPAAQPVDCPDTSNCGAREREKAGKAQGERMCSKNKILTADLQIN